MTGAAFEARGAYAGRKPLGQQIVRAMTTTDHKLIGKLYLGTSFAWFLLGGLMALVIRSELAFPGQQVVNDETYNQMFTMHGTIMLLLFATPLFFGFANVIMPLQIGSPDVAFPRLNMFSYWLFLFGGLIAASGFLTPSGAASFGWFAYTPLSNAVHSPGVGGDLWILGLWLAGLGTILGAVNFITTIITMRAPGLTMFRMSIFTWNTLVTSLLVLIAFPILAGALLMLEADRLLGAHVYDPSSRSDASISSAPARIGKAISTSRLVTRVFQVKIGIRNIVRPGARMVMIVVMKLTAPRIVPRPASQRPMIQRSPPMPGEFTSFDSGV